MNNNFSLSQNIYYLTEELEERYVANYSKNPFNISFWNPSEVFKIEYQKVIKFPDNDLDLFNYFYSYEIPQEKKEYIKKYYGFNNNKKILFTDSGTNSINLFLEWLKFHRVTNITIISPCYFTIPYLLNKINISFNILYINKNTNKYTIQLDKLNNLSNNDLIWITNPAYNTNFKYTQKIIKYLKKLLQNGIKIFADESLSFFGNELSHELGNNENFFGIYSPHKVISFNSLKFSFLAYDKKYHNFFDKTSDLVNGSISMSSQLGIKHFLSNNFTKTINKFISLLYESYLILCNLVNKFYNIHIDSFDYNYYITCYIDRIDYKILYNRKELWKIIDNTGVSFFPWSDEKLTAQLGFSFRINLTRINNSSIIYLQKLFSYIIIHYDTACN